MRRGKLHQACIASWSAANRTAAPAAIVLNPSSAAGWMLAQAEQLGGVDPLRLVPTDSAWWESVRAILRAVRAEDDEIANRLRVVRA